MRVLVRAVHPGPTTTVAEGHRSDPLQRFDVTPQNLGWMVERLKDDGYEVVGVRYDDEEDAP